MLITSRDNPTVRRFRKLLADGKARREEHAFVIEGARLCGDAALSGIAIQAALYTSRAAEAYPSQLAQVRAACRELYEIPESLAKALADTASPQGIFCLCGMLDNRTAFGTIGRNPPRRGYLALENMQDPANLGTVIRTAEALGLDGLLLSDGCCDIYNPKVLRGSMGGVFRLPFAYAGEMAEAVRVLQGRGLECWACVVDRDAVPLPEAGLTPRSVCVVGNEGAGLRPETAAACAHRLTIPMAGRAESLNASTAAGIVMWEMTRRLPGAESGE